MAEYSNKDGTALQCTSVSDESISEETLHIVQNIILHRPFTSPHELDVVPCLCLVVYQAARWAGRGY